MLCKQCGNELKENEKFCGKCGTKRENLEEKKAGLLPQNKEELKKEIAMKGEMAKERVFKFWEVGKSWLLEKWEMGKDFYKRKQKQVIGVGVGAFIFFLVIIFVFGGGKKSENGTEMNVAMNDGMEENIENQSLEEIVEGDELNSVEGEGSVENNQEPMSEEEETVNLENMTDEERLEYDKNERWKREKDWEVNAAYSSSVLLTEEEWNFGYYENDRSGGRRGGSSTGIEEVYAGNGQRFVNIAESKSFPFELESKIFEASNTQASGELMLRFEMILFGKDTGSFSRYYEPSGKDILPLAEEVKHYLKHWGVNKYEPIEKEKLLRTHNGYIYPFYGVDPKGYTITVYAYFETIFDEHLDRIVVWTEDGF